MNCWYIIFSVISIVLLPKPDPQAAGSCHQFSEDDLKWKMYTLSYNSRLTKMTYQGPGKSYVILKDSVFLPVESAIAISNRSTSGDTTLYSMEFKRSNLNDRYRQFPHHYVGIGYIKSTGNYFPIDGQNVLQNFNGFEDFFLKHEEQFIQYLKTYKGPLAAWLRAEAIKRKVLTP